MNSTTKTISYITLITLIAKLFGFFREMVIAAYYGASWQTDAFNMANSIIGLSTAIISTGIATVIVPMYTHKLAQKGKDEADYFASNILCITSLVYGVLSVLGIIFAPYLVRLFAPNFKCELSELSLQILKILFACVVLSNVIGFLSAISQANKRFMIPVIVRIPSSFSTILLVLLFSRRIGIYAMVISSIVSVLIQLLMLIMSLRKKFKFTPVLNFTNGDIKAIAILCIPIFFSIGIDEIGSMIDKMLASGLSEGSITAIGYANRLKELPFGIIAAAILTVIFPTLSQYAAKREFASLKALVVKSMTILLMVMLPVTIVCVYYAKEIVRIAYERGAFTHDQTLLTAHIFIFSVISLFSWGGCGVLNNTFYGMQDTKTPRLGAVITVASDIILNIILVRYMQAAGLVLATSISIMLNYVLLLIFFRRKCGPFGGFALVRNTVKCTAASVGMLPVFFLCENFRGIFPVLIFWSISVILGLICYAILMYVMKVDIFMLGLEKAKGFLKIKKNNL